MFAYFLFRFKLTKIIKLYFSGMYLTKNFYVQVPQINWSKYNISIPAHLVKEINNEALENSSTPTQNMMFQNSHRTRTKKVAIIIFPTAFEQFYKFLDYFFHNLHGRPGRLKSKNDWRSFWYSTPQKPWSWADFARSRTLWATRPWNRFAAGCKSTSWNSTRWACQCRAEYQNRSGKGYSLAV